MIYSITGLLRQVAPTYCVIEACGVGYQCSASTYTLSSLPGRGQEVTLLTHLWVKEDGMELFGFKSVRELEQSIPRWLSIEIPEQAGRMMQLFRMEHLENRFTRMVTVSAGAPETGLRALANDIGVLSLTVTKDVSEPRAVLLNGVENIEIPAEGDAKIKILC